MKIEDLVYNSNKVPVLEGKIENICKIKIVSDINGTTYKAGDQVDVNHLQLIQAQKYGQVQWKLNTGLELSIVCQGDSLTYGHDISSDDIIQPVPPHTVTRAGVTYPEALATNLNSLYNNKITVINQGFSGDDCKKSYNRWTTNAGNDLTIIMLGSNDSSAGGCDYKGDVEQYLYWYEQLIIRELIWGHAVILMKSPRTLWANDKKIEAFSNSVELLGCKYNIPVIDPNPFVSSCDLDIWSDLTEANVNKICKHFSSKGYKMLGAGVSSILVGESLTNAKHISSGDVLLCREQVDGVRYISGVMCSEVYTAYSPQERTVDRSIIARTGANGKLVYSFYADCEDLVVIPTAYCYANSTFKMTLDFGNQQPYPNLTSKYKVAGTNNVIIEGIKDLNVTEDALYRKDAFRYNKIEPLRITRKGWHTLIIEANDCMLYGVEFLDFLSWEDYKKELIYEKIVDGMYSLTFDGRVADIMGKVSVPMPEVTNVAEITGLPSNFTILNKQVAITNKTTKATVSIYGENGKTYVEVVNNGNLSDTRIAVVDYRLFGYYS